METLTTVEQSESRETGYVRHIIKEGARYHVLSWFLYKGIGFTKCSEPHCEINRHYDEFEKKTLPK